jgi:hypothetical protein
VLSFHDDINIQITLTYQSDKSAGVGVKGHPYRLAQRVRLQLLLVVLLLGLLTLVRVLSWC